MLIKTCKKHNISYFSTIECPLCKDERKSLEDIKPEQRLRTPSDLDIPVHVVCPPIFQEIYVDNNIYMEELTPEQIADKVYLYKQEDSFCEEGDKKLRNTKKSSP